MSRSSEEILEFDRLRELVRGQTTSPAGRRAVDALGFRTNRTELEREFAAVAEAMAYLRANRGANRGEGTEIGFGDVADPEPWLARLGVPGAVLAAPELLNVATLVDAAAWLREMFRDLAGKFPLLTERVRSLADMRALAVAIRRAILPNGEMSDDASPELRRIRGGIARTRETIHKTLERMLRARGPVKYADLSTQRGKDYVFDYDRMLSFEGNTARYLQYAHARICSIFRRSGLEPPDANRVIVTEPAERALAIELLAFAGVVTEVAGDLECHRLAQYLYGLASAFTDFYERCPVLRAEGEVRTSRLACAT